MRMNEVRLRVADDLFQASSSQAHLGEQACTFRTRCAVEEPAIDLVLQRGRHPLLWRRQMYRLPAKGALLTQDRQRPKAVAAVQW